MKPKFPYADITTMYETTTKYPLSGMVVIEQFVSVISSGLGHYTEQKDWYFKDGKLLGCFKMP